MKIAIWAEKTKLAGVRAWRHEAEDNWDSDMIVVYEGSENDILMYIERHESISAYNHCVALTLRDVLKEEED